LEFLKTIEMNVKRSKEFVTELFAPKEQEKNILQNGVPVPTSLDLAIANGFQNQRELVKVRVGKEMSTRTVNTIEKVMELVEHGKGTDIPGVKGTGYGVYNAVGEYADHYMSTRASGETDQEKEKNQLENRFLSSIMGSGADLKQRAFNKLIEIGQGASV